MEALSYVVDLRLEIHKLFHANVAHYRHPFSDGSGLEVHFCEIAHHSFLIGLHRVDFLPKRV